jgi:pimeloyl-ACP methyl ester carboxylesterase
MQISANGLRIEVEDHGAPSGEPLVLVMGLGMQLLAWPDDFVAMLVSRGFRVIRFDNRDIGLSQHFDALGVPNVALVGMKAALGLHVKAPYTLADMAADAVGVLDALGIARAHWVGASMGGMILQHVGSTHADRVKSLALLMTTSGARRLPGPSMKVRGALLGKPADPSRLESIVDHYVRLYGLIGSPGFPQPAALLRERLTRSITRSYHPAGVARQLVAIVADGDRTARLAHIAAPTAVLHGRADPLVPVAAAHDLAARIRASTLDVIDGWGHDLPPGVWPRLVERIASNAARAA